MKFKLFCSLHQHGKRFFAESDLITIRNVLLAHDDICHSEMEHEFVVLVNKNGQLTVLCVK